jgi:hypothetical protein
MQEIRHEEKYGSKIIENIFREIFNRSIQIMPFRNSVV